MIPKLELRLLGAPQMCVNGQPLEGFVTRKAQALLIYLALNRRSHTREGIATFFWGDVADPYARNSLRRVLPNLRELVGDYLRIDRNTLAFAEGSPYWIDVDDFRDKLTALSAAATPLDVSRLEKGLQLYQSDFLASFVVRDAPAFEEWVLLQREHLRTLAIQGFTRLAEQYMALGDAEAGLDATKRLLAIEPWCETGHHQRMMLLAQTGQRIAALAQYETCRTILADEFATEPSPTMTALYQQIKAGTHDRGAALPTKLRPEAASFTHAASLAALTKPLTPTYPTTQHIDWGEIPRPTTFRGRERELAQLRQWLIADQCALVTVVGVGGVGKTTLTAQLVRSLAQATSPEPIFERIIWRSLVNAPPLAVVMRMWLQTLTDQPLVVLPTALDEQLALLFEQLRRRRCLLVLDNLESILQGGEYAGQFRPEYEEYAQLVQRFGEVEHRSCLLLTSREQPTKVARFERDYLVARTLHLAGVTTALGISILQTVGLYGAAEEMAALVERYSGNPLALKLVAETVVEQYQGDTTFFLEHEALLFDDIRDVLAQQFSRITEVERDLLIWLAIEREPMTSSAVGANFAQPPTRRSLLEAQRSLYRRSLVEQEIANELGKGEGEVKLSLQNVVLEYVTNTLLETLSAELESEALNYFLRYALVKAQAKDYIRAVQQRLILQPIAQRLQESYGAHGVEAKIQQLLNKVRQDSKLTAGYAAANLLHLAFVLGIKLRGWDFSQLVIWQADLRTTAVAGVNFQGSELRASTFSETFGIVKGIAISLDGRYLAAGESDGNVFLWQMGDNNYRLHYVLQGHTQPVSSVAFAPNGALLASGGFDGRVCLWNAATGEPVAMRLAHTHTVAGIAFSADGNYLASGGADRRISIWDWQRDEICHSLEETAWANDLVFSPDGRKLLVAKDDKLVNIWDWRSGTLLQTLRGHETKILAVACSPDGTLVATGGEDRRICLWQLADPAICRVLGEHTGWVWSLAFSPDSASLVSASADQTVRLWDVATGRTRQTLRGHTSWACAVAYSPDGAMIASGGYDQTIRLWDASSGLLMRTLHGYLRRVDGVAFSPDGALLASGSLDGPIHLWNIRSGQHLHRLVGHGGAIRALAFSAGNKVIAGGCDDQRVYLWDTESGALQRTLLGHTDLVRHVAFSPDGQYLVTGSHDRTLRIWEVATGRLCHLLRQAHAKIQAPTVFSPDGSVLAYGSYDGSVKLLDVGSGTVVESLPIDGEEPVVVTFNPQGQLLVCATKSGGLWVWDVGLGRTHVPTVLRLRAQTTIQTIWRIVCSSNDQLAVCGDDGAIQIFDLVSGALAYALPDEGGVFNLTFSREGRYLVTADKENTLLIRDAGSGEVCRTLGGHLTELTSLVVSPLEDVIASSSADGMVQLWSMSTGDCLATLEPAGPYAGMNISGVTGITETQRTTLAALGAIPG